MAYYKEDDFAKHLEKNGLPKKYKGYITTIYKKILKPNGITILLDVDDLGKCLAQDKDKAINGLKTISTFIRRVYSLSKQQDIGVKSLSFIVNHGMTPRSFNDYAVGLDKYIEYLQTIQIERIKERYLVTPWNQACGVLNELFYDNISVNGMDSLMDRFSNNDDFIAYALKNSFFFENNMAKEHFNDIVVFITNKKVSVPARNSRDINIQHKENNEDYFYCTNEINNKQEKIRISIDSDGNKAVRELIETKTGYTLSSGEKCLFTNYIISHIWGNAFDPRNFTNFWNLALVPAWTNSLLDKHNYNDKLTKQLLNTFKAICMKHYGMKSLLWNKIYRNCPSLDPQYVLRGKYPIHVINQKKGLKPYGAISVKIISIDDNDINEWSKLFPVDTTADVQ